METLESLESDLWTKPVILIGNKLRLEPFHPKYLDDLERHLLSPKTWHYAHWGANTRADLENWVGFSANGQIRQKDNNAFVFIIKETNEAVGLSQYMNLNRRHNGLEIGATWIAEKFQKTFVNTEAKYLMLSYAFETLQCQRVEFRVDSLNINSQKAVLRVGAKYEGELRKLVRLPNGFQRDYKIFSIIDSEWPTVKQTLNWNREKYV